MKNLLIISRTLKIHATALFKGCYSFVGCLALMMFLFTSTEANALEADEAEEVHALHHSLGIGAGLTTGIGLSYRYLPNKIGAQLNFAPLRVDEYETTVSLGLTFIYRLIAAEKSNFFIYQGNHFMYEKWKGYYDPYTSISDTYRTFNHGIGLGFELIVLNHVGFNIMFGYAVRDNFSSLGLTGETAIYYKF